MQETPLIDACPPRFGALLKGSRPLAAAGGWWRRAAERLSAMSSPPASVRSPSWRRQVSAHSQFGG